MRKIHTTILQPKGQISQKPQKLQIHKISYIKDLENPQKAVSVLNIRLQLEGMSGELSSVVALINPT